MENDKKDKKKKNKLWPLKVFFLALGLSFMFSAISESLLIGANLVIALVILFIFVLISIVFDVIGVAVTVCDNVSFVSMASRKIRGAKTCIKLLKSASVVSTVCNDIVGDICGILSGAMGASIVIKLSMSAESIWSVIVPIIISSLIASLTVSGKALGKGLAMKYSENIVFFVGRLMSVFNKNG